MGEELEHRVVALCSQGDRWAMLPLPPCSSRDQSEDSHSEPHILHSHLPQKASVTLSFAGTSHVFFMTALLTQLAYLPGLLNQEFLICLCMASDQLCARRPSLKQNVTGCGRHQLVLPCSYSLGREERDTEVLAPRTI